MRENPYYSDAFRRILAEYEASSSNLRTAREYIAAANLICTYLNKDFLDITENDAVEYFEKLRVDINCGKLTRKTFCFRLSACKAISSYIEEIHPEIGSENPFCTVIRPSVNSMLDLKAIPSMEELDRIMSAAKESSLMDYLILALATRMCLSATSILRLTDKSIRMENGKPYLLVAPPEHSYREPRYVRIPDDVYGIFMKYLKESPADPDGHIFFNEYHAPLRLRSLDNRVRKIVSSSGIGKHYTLKDLRSRGVIDLYSSSAGKENATEYVGIGPVRADAFVTAAKYITDNCAPNLVNYSLKVM